MEGVLMPHYLMVGEGMFKRYNPHAQQITAAESMVVLVAARRASLPL